MSNSISNELTITPFNGGIKLVTPSLVNKFNLMGIKEFADLPFMTYLYNRLDESVVKISEECANVCGFDSSLSATGKSIFHYTDSISTQKVLSNNQNIYSINSGKIVDEEITTTNGFHYNG